MKAAVIEAVNKLVVREVPEPVMGDYDCLCQGLYGATCSGTDLHLQAAHPLFGVTFPSILGHESIGRVIEVGPKVRNFEVGQRAIGGLVFDFSDPAYSSGWGGFCEYTLANDHDAMVADGVATAGHGWFECYEIQRPAPMDIPVEAALLMCTWREVYGGFGDFQLKPGADILVFGAGPVGLSFVKLARLLGLGYIGVVDPLEAKRRRAVEMGADEAFPPGSPALSGLQVRRGKPLDAVIDAVGRESIANAALSLIGMGGSICIYGVLAEPSITIHKHQGPYNFNLFVHQWPTRSRERAAMEPLCAWVRQGQLRAADFITHEFPVERIAEAIEAVRSGEALKVLLRY